MKANDRKTDVELSREAGEVPSTISIRTADMAPALKRWRKSNKRVAWSCLLRDALEHYFKKEAA